MAIVKYKCNVCKREIELQQNIHGLETPGKCIITYGCRGTLYIKELLPDFVRGRAPKNVTGLDNWEQRKILYNYTQTIARNEWVITHNLGNSANVSVFVNRPTQKNPDNLVEIKPTDIIIISPDEIRLMFNRPYSGKAQLVARASDPQLLQSSPTNGVIVEAEPIQLSSSGEITIATKLVGNTNPIINLQLTYATPQKTTQQLRYQITAIPNILSPWNDYNQIIINNSLYTVRSFSGIKPEMLSGVIGNGTTFMFTAIDGDNTNNFRPIIPSELFLLLSSPPYTNIDKTTDKLIDVTDVSSTKHTFAFSYDLLEFFNDPVVEQTTYPIIHQA